MTTELKIKKIKFHDFGIEFYSNAKNQICGKYFKILTKGKNKGSQKIIEHYRFSNEERRNEWAKNLIEKVNKKYLDEQKENELKKNALSNLINPFKVGQLFYRSWGYEQTNIDFYQVIETKNKSVVLRKVKQQIVPGSEGFMSERVIPVKDGFFEDSYWDETIKKKIKVYVLRNGEIEYSIGLHEFKNREDGIYQSHYA